GVGELLAAWPAAGEDALRTDRDGRVDPMQLDARTRGPAQVAQPRALLRSPRAELGDHRALAEQLRDAGLNLRLERETGLVVDKAQAAGAHLVVHHEVEGSRPLDQASGVRGLPRTGQAGEDVERVLCGGHVSWSPDGGRRVH